MFGGDVDVQGAVLFVAIGQFGKLEAAFAVYPAFFLIHFGLEREFIDHDFRRRDGAGGVDEGADLQIGDQVHQLVELDVVAYAFFPFHGETVKLNMAVAERNIVATVAGIAGDTELIQANAAFVGQLDVYARRLQLMMIAAPAAIVIGLAAETFPIELDAGKFFIIKSGNSGVDFARTAEINGVAHAHRRLVAEEAFQHFSSFRLVLKLGFYMSAYRC